MYAYSSPPMWSMGTSNRGDELKVLSSTHSPAPTAYFADEQYNPPYAYPTYPEWKIGTSKRPNLYGSSNQDVGPGSYENSKGNSKKHPKKTFAQGLRGQSETKGMSTVGPDAYNPKGFGRAPPSFSFGYKTDGFTAAHKSDVPGPGAYDTKDEFEQIDEKGNKTRNAFNRTAPQALTRSRQPGFGSSDLPGPGTHNPDKDNYDFRYFTPTWSFGKSGRDDLYNENIQVPGPGKYQVAGTISTKTGFTILGKNQVKGNSNIAPGPNVYNQDIAPLRQTAPAFRIGKAPRKGMAAESPDVPGPGAYRGDKLAAGKSAKFGTSERPGHHTKRLTKGPEQVVSPGPGAYNVRGDITKGIKYSMAIKGAKKAGEVYPGPGEYEPFGSLYLEKTIGAIIGTSHRPGLYKKGVAPGPGQYEIIEDISTGTKSKIGNGKRQPMSKVNDEPGPGYYNIPSAIANVQKYLLPYYAEEKRRANSENEGTFRGIFAPNSD